MQTPTDKNLGAMREVLELLDKAANRENFATIADAARAFSDLQNIIAEFREQKAMFEKIYDRFRFSILPSLLEDEDVTSITVEGVGRVGITDDINVTVPDKPKFYEWLVKEGFEDMITEQVNAQTLTAFVRKRLKAGQDLPNDLIVIKPFSRASITHG